MEKTAILKAALIVSMVLLTALSGSAFADGTYSGGTGEPNDPYLIATPADMNEIGTHTEDWGAHFLLVNDINLAEYTGTQFNIIGNYINFFTGVFDGNGHTISNFTWNLATADYVGLFGYVSNPNAEIKDVKLIDSNILGNYRVGALVGWLQDGTITGCCVEGGTVSGNWYVGGLTGYNHGTISNCYVTGNIQGDAYFGGLCGENERGIILNCYATGSVTGGDNSYNNIGGLCGYNYYGTIFNCYATGNVSSGYASDHLGGLCGMNAHGIISNCYATGSVAGGNDSYCFGGLVGRINSGITSNCYATGNVTGGNNSDYLGGLCGYNSEGRFANCFWDIQTSGLIDGIGNNDPDPSGVTGLTTAEMKTQSTFTDTSWDFVNETANGTSDLWVIQPGQYPELTVLSNSFGPYVFAGGSGAESEPYQIYNAQDFGAVWQYPQACFILNNDVNLSGIEWYYAVVPILFTGRFEGNGFNVSNLSISGINYLGLFARIGLGGEVKNLRVENVTIVGGEDSDNLGGLCGYNYYGTISDCYTTGFVIGGDNSRGLGGLCGWITQGNLFDSYSTCSVEGGDYSEYLGGLCGLNDRATISNCYATGNVTVGDNSDYLGGLCGRNFDGTISNSFWDVNTSGLDVSDGGTGLITSQMQTESTFTDAGWDFLGESANGMEDYWRLCEDGTDYPKLSSQFFAGDFVCPDGVEMNDLTVLIEQWLLEELAWDVYPQGGDGFVDFYDWAVLANRWKDTADMDDLADFVEQWLQPSAYCADITPAPDGDNFVNLSDFAFFALHWLEGY